MKEITIYILTLVFTISIVGWMCTGLICTRNNKADIIYTLDLSDEYKSKDLEYLRAMLYERQK